MNCMNPINPMNRVRPGIILAFVAIFAAWVPSGAEIPAPKLELMKQAMASMRLDQRIHGMVAHRVELRLKGVLDENPGLSDSLASEVRGVIAEVYAVNLEGRNGLMPRVYAVLDRHLTEEDLRFAVNFRESDQGRRYREKVPRVVNESLETGRDWAERLEPDIRRRLEVAFRGTELKF